MTASYKSLDQYLQEIGLSVAALSARTGITMARLESIYKHGKLTQRELVSLAKAMSPEKAALFVTATQTGNFNQNGSANSQNIVINNYNVLIHVAPASPPRTRPRKPKSLGEVPQQWESNQVLPIGVQAVPFGLVASPNGHGF